MCDGGNYRIDVLLALPGLVSLDGTPFTSEERAAAAEEGERRREEERAKAEEAAAAAEGKLEEE